MAIFVANKCVMPIFYRHASMGCAVRKCLTACGKGCVAGVCGSWLERVAEAAKAAGIRALSTVCMSFEKVKN